MYRPSLDKKAGPRVGFVLMEKIITFRNTRRSSDKGPMKNEGRYHRASINIACSASANVLLVIEPIVAAYWTLSDRVSIFNGQRGSRWLQIPKLLEECRHPRMEDL